MVTHRSRFFTWVIALAILALAMTSHRPIGSAQSAKDNPQQPGHAAAAQSKAGVEAEVERLKTDLLRSMQQADLTPGRLAEIREMEARLDRVQKELVKQTSEAGRSLSALVPPPNDNCAMATPITNANCPFTDRQNTVEATNERREPGTTCGSLSTPTQSNSVWYRFTNTSGNRVAITVATNGSNYDTVVQVYVGGCNQPVAFCCDDDSGLGAASEITFLAEPNLPYSIKVAQWDEPGGGQLVFTLECETMVANDVCQNAAEVVLTRDRPLFEQCIDTSSATQECGEVFFGVASVWYRVTASQDGVLDLSTFGSTPSGTATDYDSSIIVYDAETCLPTLSEIIAVNDDFKGDIRSRVAAIVTAGQRVLVRVGSFGGGTGALCVRFLFTPTCP